jgi:L-ascorbate metabolism protein UlaG (beta-lactamase superfamily)
VSHATFVMAYGRHPVYVDPVGDPAAFEGMPAAHVIVVTDIHGDHFNLETLTVVAGSIARIIAPAAVADQLPDELKARTTVLANGESTDYMTMSFEAVPMYNLAEDRLQYHTKGRGNGYVVTMGGTRIYISGDTEDIPEMRALQDIDVAFLCFNLPYTMTEEQAAAAVKAFQPGVVYPYHYRGSDPQKFASLVGNASEVRPGNWYPDPN